MLHWIYHVICVRACLDSFAFWADSSLGMQQISHSTATAAHPGYCQGWEDLQCLIHSAISWWYIGANWVQRAMAIVRMGSWEEADCTTHSSILHEGLCKFYNLMLKDICMISTANTEYGSGVENPVLLAVYSYLHLAGLEELWSTGYCFWYSHVFSPVLLIHQDSSYLQTSLVSKIL